MKSLFYYGFRAQTFVNQAGLFGNQPKVDATAPDGAECMHLLIHDVPSNIAAMMHHKSDFWQAGKSVYRHELSMEMMINTFNRSKWEVIEAGKVIAQGDILTNLRNFLKTYVHPDIYQALKGHRAAIEAGEHGVASSIGAKLPHVRIYTTKQITASGVRLFTPH